MIQIPGQNGWKSAQNSDLFGAVVRTKNIDFDKEGYIRLARKPEALYTSDSDEDLVLPRAFAYDGTYYYVVGTDGSSGMHSLSLSDTSISAAQITNTSAPTMFAGSDAVVYQGDVHVSGTTKIESYNTGSGWTERVTSLNSSYPHPMVIVGHRNELAVADKNTVKTYNTSYSLQNTLTIPTKYIITTLDYKDNRIFIGTRTTDGSESQLFIWGATGTSAQSAWPCGAQWIYSVKAFKSSVVVVTSAGQLLWFNGGGFDPLANFPVYYTPLSWVSSNATTGYGNVLHRGMLAVGDILFINLQGTSNNRGIQGYKEMPSGLWVYDPSIGLYHKAGYVSELYKSLSLSSVQSSIVNFSAEHGAETGDVCWATGVTNITGINTGQRYYVIKESSTAIKVAFSAADAFNGIFLVCSGTVSGDNMIFTNATQVASTFDTQPGPVFAFNATTPNIAVGSDILYGGRCVDPEGNNVDTVMSLGSGRNVGTFETPTIYAAGLEDTFNKIAMYVNNIDLDTDKVVVKYRTRSRFGLPTPVREQANGVATWVDDASFTIDTTAKAVRQAQIGDEVEILSGAGAGYSAHITEINDTSSTFTFTLDESIPLVSVGQVSEVCIDNWQKLGEITNTSATIARGYDDSKKIDGSHTKLQLKFELRGTEIEIPMLELLSSISKQKTA